MKGRLLRAVALLSLLAALGIGLLSGRSRDTRDNLWWCGGAGRRLWWAESVNGQLAVRTATPWPVAARGVWTVAPAEDDMYLVTAAGRRPLIRLSVLNQPPDWRGLHTHGWESRRLVMRFRYGRVTTNETGELNGSMPMHMDAENVMRFHEVLVPHWMAGLAGAVPAMLWGAALVPSIVRKRRARRGLCAGCGYDLTGNLSGVCPECGRGTRQSISKVASDTVQTAMAHRTGTTHDSENDEGPDQEEAGAGAVAGRSARPGGGHQ